MSLESSVLNTWSPARLYCEMAKTLTWKGAGVTVSEGLREFCVLSLALSLLHGEQFSSVTLTPPLLRGTPT